MRMSRGVHFLLFLFIATLGDECPKVIIGGSEKLLALATKPCIIPDNKEYHYVTSEGDRLSPGWSVNGDGKFVVGVRCYNLRRIIKPADFAVCFDGQLYPSYHTCELIPVLKGIQRYEPLRRKCAPKYDSYSMIFSCTTLKGVEVSCELPAEPGTKLTIQCAHWRYKSQHMDMIQEKVCLRNGEWEQYNNCQPQCGQLINNNGSDDKSYFDLFGKYPWHASIFVYKYDKWTFFCTATVISNVLVITASICFEKSSRKNLSLKVGVGLHSKNYRDFPSSALYDVAQIYLLQNSITVIGVREYIEFGDMVASICLGDVLKLDARIERIEFLGEDSKISEEMKCMSNKICQSFEAYIPEIDSDKFCCRFETIHTFGREDIGSGFFQKTSNGSYVLEGVIIDLFPYGYHPIAIYKDVREEVSRNFITQKALEFDEWLLVNRRNWWRTIKKESIGKR